MSSEPRAFATVDLGTATAAVSLIGRVDGHWRLLGATAGPVSVPPEALLERMRSRLAAADPALATDAGLSARGAAADLARVACATTEPPGMVVVAATERALAPLVGAAAMSGWQLRPVALEGADIITVATLLAEPRNTAVLAGAGDPPGADERPLLPEIASLLAAATSRRPELAVVLAGGFAEPGGKFETVVSPDRPGATLVAPSPGAADGLRLRELLDELRAGDVDGRRAIGVATETLADVLDRQVEVLDIGQSAGVRAAAAPRPGLPGMPPSSMTAVVADAALLPRGFTDAHLDAVRTWLTVPLDRLRVRDRLRELALVPWGDAAGDGALLRVAAAKAAVGRLLAATPALGRLPAPDLLVASGGAWSVAPGPAVALALADVVRRPGVRALGIDRARLLGPLGTIEDAGERRRVIADLRDELIVPLGTIVMPSGLRAGHPAGHVVVQGRDGETGADLVAGGIELFDLPPGDQAVVDLRFRDTVDLGPRARHVAVEVTGGLGGLLVDLRDVPLRLPDRHDARREALVGWQSTVWAGVDL